MACGIGVCMTCVLPVIGDDGRTRMVRRPASRGRSFGGDGRCDDVGTIPPRDASAPTRPAAAGGHA